MRGGPAGLRLVLAGLLLGLAGCGTVPTVTTPTRTPAPVPPTAPPTVAPSPTVSVQPSPAPLGGPVLVLSGTGLELADRPGGDLRPLSFGASTSQVVEALGEALAATPVPVDRPECSAGPRRQIDVGGFSALFADDRFVGWADRGSGTWLLTTSDGLGLRSRLGDLTAARPGVVLARDGELGLRAVLPDGLTFLLDGRFARSQVTGVLAGQTC